MIMIGRVAVYVIIPEIILGLSAYYGYEIIKEKPHWYKFPIAFLVMILYIGCAVFFYFLIESAIFP